MEETVAQKIKRRLEKNGYFIQSNIDGEDEHLMIGLRDGTGEKAHLIIDGETGEIRIEPNRKAPHEVLQEIETILTTKNGDKIRTTRTSMTFIEGEDLVNDIPVLDIAKDLAPSGGPSGHFIYFTVNNVGSKTAIDCHLRITGFGYHWQFPDTFMQSPLPADPKRIEYKISGEKPFSETVPELKVVLQYLDYRGRRYETYRELYQQRVPSGEWYELRVGDFHPAVMVTENAVMSISSIYRVDQTITYACDFEVKTKNGEKVVTIAIGKPTLSGWGFSDLPQMQAAIREIGIKKIKVMLVNGNLEDCSLSRSDFPEARLGGFEDYKLCRDSITL